MSSSKQQKQKKPRSENFISNIQSMMESTSFRKPCISPDSSDSESYHLSSEYDEEPTGGRHHKRSDISESSSKKHSRLLGRKRTKDSKLNHTVLLYYSFSQESSRDQKNFILAIQSLMEIYLIRNKDLIMYHLTVT